MTKKILKNYFNILDKLFYEISEFEKKNQLIDEKIIGSVCHSGFKKRLN